MATPGIPVQLAELLERTNESRLTDVWTGIVGTIQTYYPGKNPTADIIPMVKRPVPAEDGSVVYEDLPVIPNVPILFPRGTGGTYSITWPLAPGDGVQVWVDTLSFDQWRTSAQLSEPQDLRLHSLGNCKAYPGVGPDSEAIGGAGTDPSSLPALVVEGPAIMLGKDATDHVALAALVKAEFTTLKNAIAAAVAPGGAGGVLTGFTYTPGDVAALKVKAE